MDQAYEQALKSVKKKRSFYKELSVFVPVAIGLFLLNYLTSPDNLWFYWAIGPWGLTLLGRGLSLYFSEQSKEWEQREICKELILLGKDPDDYLEDQLELDELHLEYTERGRSHQTDDEFV